MNKLELPPGFIWLVIKAILGMNLVWFGLRVLVDVDPIDTIVAGFITYGYIMASGLWDAA